MRVKLSLLVAILLLASCAEQPSPVIGTNAPQPSSGVIGTRIVFEVDVDSTSNDALDSLEFDVRKLMRQHRIGYRTGPSTHDGFSICALDDVRVAGAESAIRLLVGMPDRKNGGGLPIFEVNRDAKKCIVVAETTEFRKEFLDDVMSQEMEVAKRRASYASQIPIKAQRLSSNRFQLDIPKALELGQIPDIFATSAELALRLVNDSVTDDDIRGKRVPKNTEILEWLPQGDKTPPPLAVYRDTVLSGIWIDRVTTIIEEGTGKPAISMSLDERYVEAFAEFTKKNIGRSAAVVMNGKVITAPQILTPITGGTLQITGDFTQEQARTLADQLNAGAIPAVLRIVDAQVTDLAKP